MVFYYLSIFLALSCAGICSEQQELEEVYREHCERASDINEHLPVLRKLAEECSSVVEIGLRTLVSTWGILQGLAENPASVRSYVGIDRVKPSSLRLKLAKRLAEGNGISFEYWKADDMTIDIPPVEMLFIDSLHTYCHMTYELEKFSSKVSKVICMHDTSDPWGNVDQSDYNGDRSEYPAFIDRNKRGVWPAVQDFLARHPEWRLEERRTNNYGFTILRRM